MTSTDHQYDTFWPRFWALLVDGLLFFPLIFLEDFIYEGNNSKNLVFGVYFLFGAVSYSLYRIVMHGKYGQTLGKMLLKVKARSIHGGSMNYRQALLREIVPLGFSVVIALLSASAIYSGAAPHNAYELIPIAQWFDWGATLWVVIDIMTFFSSYQCRALHDFIGKTVVYRI